MSSELVARFLAAVAAAGIHSREPIGEQLATGRLVRFRAQGDAPGWRGGWATLQLDGNNSAGAFGHYRLGVHESWRADRVEQLAPQVRRGRARQLRAQLARHRTLPDGATGGRRCSISRAR